MTLITFSAQEYKALEQLVARTKDATHLRRAQALLWLDAGERVPTVAARLRVSRRTIYNWITRFQEPNALHLTARLSESTRPGRPRTAAGVIDPLIQAVTDCD